MQTGSVTGMICISVLLSSQASATQWGYPLTSLPEGWIATPEWGFGSWASVHLYASAGVPGQSEIWHAYIISDEFIIPAETVETVLEFDHTWELWGIAYSEEEGFSSVIEVLYSIDGDTQPVLLEYYDSITGQFNPQGSEVFSCTVGASPGDTLRFVYHAMVSAGCWGEPLDASADLFLLTAYDGQALQPTTWAEIKNFAVMDTEPE